MGARISPDELRRQVAAGDLAAVYVLYGNDSELRSELAGLIVGTLDEGLRDFNYDRYFVPDSRPEARKQFWAVIDAARTLPMMASRRVVVVGGAEKLMAVLVKDDAGRESAELARWRQYLEAPESTTTMVVSLESTDERLSASKLLLSQAAVVDCSPLGDSKTKVWERRARSERWLAAAAKRAGVTLESGAVSLLAEYFNADIGRLRSEFERLVIYASESHRVTEQMAADVIGRQALSDTWALNNAIEARDAGRALKELGLKLDAGEVPFMILGQIRAATGRLADPSRLRLAADLLFRTDLGLKTSRGEPRVLLERLVVELCGEGRAPDGAPASTASRSRWR